MTDSMDFITDHQAEQLMALSPGQLGYLDMQILGLKLQLTQAAMCHEYARMEYDNTVCIMRRGELQEEMELCHRDYQEARFHLSNRDPQLLFALEREISFQKQLVFSQNEA